MVNPSYEANNRLPVVPRTLTVNYGNVAPVTSAASGASLVTLAQALAHDVAPVSATYSLETASGMTTYLGIDATAPAGILVTEGAYECSLRWDMSGTSGFEPRLFVSNRAATVETTQILYAFDKATIGVGLATNRTFYQATFFCEFDQPDKMLLHAVRTTTTQPNFFDINLTVRKIASR